MGKLLYHINKDGRASWVRDLVRIWSTFIWDTTATEIEIARKYSSLTNDTLFETAEDVSNGERVVATVQLRLHAKLTFTVADLFKD